MYSCKVFSNVLVNLCQTVCFTFDAGNHQGKARHEHVKSKVVFSEYCWGEMTRHVVVTDQYCTSMHLSCKTTKVDLEGGITAPAFCCVD